ncbi:Formin-like protein 15 [Hordeum vulgare]|nr:Formin-like protein 15 [Hordeum vulgare]
MPSSCLGELLGSARRHGEDKLVGRPSPDVGVIAPSTPRPSAVTDLNVTPGSSNGLRPSVEMQRKQARPPSMATMMSPRVLFDEMPTPTPMPTDEDPLYNQFMKNVIYEGRGEAFQMGGHDDAFDPEETQSQDARDLHGVVGPLAVLSATKLFILEAGCVAGEIV